MTMYLHNYVTLRLDRCNFIIT